MYVWKHIIWLRNQIKEQKAWIDRCGGSLGGYIRNYGDPGVPPIDPKTGKPRVLVLTMEQQRLFCGPDVPPSQQIILKRADPGDWPDIGEAWKDGVQVFYALHSGDGGTKIYEADCNRLKRWREELSELEIKCFAAKQRADEEERKEAGSV